MKTIPMHHDKTSTQPATCPECSMDMTPIDSVLVDSMIVQSNHPQ